MRATILRRGAVGIIVALVSLSMVAGAVGAGVAGDVDAGSDLTPAPTKAPGVVAAVTTVNVTENVSVWERAALPFRIDDADAAKTAPTGAVTVEYAPANTGQIDARQTATAVYQPGTANASFESVTGADTSDFAGADAQLVVARLNDTASAPPNPMLGSVDDVASLVDPDTDRFNATYTVADAGLVGGNGALDTTVPINRPGNYVVFLTTGGNVTASGGDLSVTGPNTVVGVDTAVVEREAAAVTDASTTVDPGANASVAVVPETDRTNVSVVLYHEPTWVNSRTAVTVTERVSSSTGSPNVTLGHSISKINGQTTDETPVTVLGTTYGDGRFSQATASELIDLRANRDERPADAPETTVIGDGARLDASVVTARNVSGETTIQVPTRRNWTEGSYRWVVTTEANRTAPVRTAMGTLTVASDSGGGGFSTFDDEGPELENAAFGSSVTKTPTSVEATLTGTTPDEPVRLTIPVSDSELRERGYVVTGLTANFTRDVEGDLSVSTPAEVGVPPVSSDRALGYFVINHSMPDDSVSNTTYSFVVREQRLDDAGIDPESVALFRLGPDGWAQLPTRFVEETPRGVRFVGYSPGLSVYAIAERGAARPRFEVNATALNRSAVRTNDSIGVNATVVNRGTGPGEFTASLVVDDGSVDTRTVRVPAGEQRTLRFTHRFGATAGEYSVRVGNATVGAVTVATPTPETETSTGQPPETVTPTAEPDTTTESPTGTPIEEPGGVTPVGIIAIGIVVLLAGASVGLYRRDGGV